MGGAVEEASFSLLPFRKQREAIRHLRRAPQLPAQLVVLPLRLRNSVLELERALFVVRRRRINANAQIPAKGCSRRCVRLVGWGGGGG